MPEVLVVKSKVKALAKKNKMSMGGDAVNELSKEVAQLITKAVGRARANGRKTVKGRDV